MPALAIPVCGISGDSVWELDDGLTLQKSESGKARGWSAYAASKREGMLVFAMCTLAERNTIFSDYATNKLTGGMTFTWADGVSYTAMYMGEPKDKAVPGYNTWRVQIPLRQE